MTVLRDERQAAQVLAGDSGTHDGAIHTTGDLILVAFPVDVGEQAAAAVVGREGVGCGVVQLHPMHDRVDGIVGAP
jgi:hypothetical protein